MPRIVVTDATFPQLNHERRVAEKHGARLEEARCKTEADVLEAAAGTHVLIVQFAKIPRRAMERLAPGALIIRYGIGLDNLDLVAARDLGIKVAYVPDYATGEVADHTAALMLTLMRKIIPLDRSVRESKWDPVGVARPLQGFSESTVGFVGFGRIGREVHSRLQPFGFKTVISDPYASQEIVEKLGARSIDLDSLCQTADAITLHAPLTPTTQHLVNDRRLERMKRTAVLVNTARGALIDPVALDRALRTGQIAGAALDVFETEPLPADSSLRTAPNLILSPHAAWYSTRSADRLQALAADELDRHFLGHPPRCATPLPT